MSNLLKYIIPGVFILIAVLWVLVWFGVIPGLSGGTKVTPKMNLTIWGVDGDEIAIKGLITAFTNANPGSKIVYEKKSPESYEQELVRAFAAGKGPDIFGIHHTWVDGYGDILYPAPAEIFSQAEFADKFLDVARADFMRGSNIYGVPLYVDTLALYYNNDLFNSAGIVLPPANWDEFAQYARKLTQRKSNGEIAISGAAFGGGESVLYSPDILAMLMIQYGAQMIDKDGRVKLIGGAGQGGAGNFTEKALEFYTSFAKQGDPNFSWLGDKAGNSLNMFAVNRAAMILGYSSTKNAILAKSSKVSFGVAAVPQMKNAVFKKNYADYWGFGVYKNSKNKDAAWQFLKFLSKIENNRYYFSPTKRTASQKALVLEQQGNSEMKIFADQALTAVSWIKKGKSVIDQVFLDMIEGQISSSQTAGQMIIKVAENKINSSIKLKYK